jgi:transketolase
LRTAFIQALVRLAREDNRINLLVGDLGFGLVEAFANEFPERFLNVGVAEQNLAGIAAGMALSGKTVFTYSIANFPTFRCLEQIRNDICYHRANVKIVSVGCGLSYGALGATHHAMEDVAIMRALPELKIVAPGDPCEAAIATELLAKDPGPAYLRLGKNGDPRVHPSGEINFSLGSANTVREGTDIAIIATGTMLPTAAEVADRLLAFNIKARVLSMHTIKPLDYQSVLNAAAETGAVLTLEEHSITGGLGSAVAEVLAEEGISGVAFKRIGSPNAFGNVVGNHQYLKKLYSLDVEAVMQSALALLQRVRVCIG